MPKAKKLPSGSWRCQATFEGERESFTADTKREAEYLALQWQTGRRDLKHKGITVQDAAEQYIKARNSVLSPKTIREQKSMLKYFPPEISGMYISKIDTEIVQAWVNTMSKTKAPKTVRNHYGFFRLLSIPWIRISGSISNCRRGRKRRSIFPPMRKSRIFSVFTKRLTGKCSRRRSWLRRWD